jgi:subtilase family serine protease
MEGDSGKLLVGLAVVGAGAYLLMRGKPVGAVPTGAPTLEITSISVDPSTAYMGQPVTITVKVKNTGNASGSGKVRVTADGTPLGEYPTGTIQPGSETSVSFTWATGRAGTYQICASLV